MTKRKIFFIIILFLVILTACRLVWLHYFTIPEHPHASQGMLDLRHWDPMTDHTILLDGEWEYYSEVLLLDAKEEAGVPDSDSEKRLVQVPGSWEEYDETLNVHSFGSYRLRILTNPDLGRTFGIHIPDIKSSSEVYVNGELIAHSGKPAEHRSSYEPSMTPNTAFFTLKDTHEIELVIHAANYEYPYDGGMVRSITFGLAGPFQQETTIATNIVLIACMVYLVHALYSFILFLVGNRDTKLLYFSLLITCIIIATLIGEELLFAWLPLNYEWSVKVTLLGMIAGGYLLLQCIKHLLPIKAYSKYLNAYYVLCGFSGFLILLLPAAYNWLLILLYMSLMFIPCILALYVMFRATYKINSDNIFLLLAAVASIGSFIWLIIILAFKIDVISYPIDLMVATICFSIYWFKKYFRVLSESQAQAVQLQEVDKHKDEFLTMIAHEMRNPLYSMLNISQSVLDTEYTKIGENSKSDLILLATIGRHMSTLLDTLLDLERLKEKSTVIEPETGSIHTLAAAVIDMIRFMTEGRSVKLINQIPDNFPLVYGDKKRLIQILFNLLHNAVKHSQASEIAVNATIQGEWARISVTDNGIGINMDVVNNEHGLGLNICKQLVELHGGSLEISSRPNQGSTFSFPLKLSKQSELEEQWTETEVTDGHRQIAVTAASSSKSSMPLIPEDTIRILAVDDDPINLKVIRSIFSSAPYEVVTALSGNEALSMLDTGAWDAVIIDVMMPQMSGYELTHKVRERFSISELPILLLTARSQPEDIVTGYLSGANDYVTKPIEGFELRLRINTLANLKKSIDERRLMEAALFQARIQPHFLFNTINSIASLSEVDPERMIDLLVEFGNYLRKSFDSKNLQRVVPIEHELELLHSYLFIEKQRFGERLNIIWEVDPKIELYLPPLSIQPLVENAVKHGVLKRKKGGTIRIRITDAGDVAHIAIIDDGVGMNEEEIQQILGSDYRKGFGIYNTNWRLKQLYGEGINIKSSPDLGTVIRFRVPKT